MANGRSTHQPAKRASRLVALRPDAQIYNLPLLPYEWQLIEALGCTETEYRRYRQSLVNAGLKRPAAYDHIPEVVAGPVAPILISLAIGAALTAVSALLQPKPKQQRKIKQGGQVKLDDQQGQSRFNQTQGFGGVQEVSSLGEVIPIPFGRYEQHERASGKFYTGGLSAAPRLVWSRMFSYGTHQGFKGIYAVGECLGNPEVDGPGSQDPTRPDHSSVQLGTLPMDSVPPQQQALYWNTNYGDGRIKAADLIYGTRAETWAGDPETQDDVFTCPIEGNPHGDGFSMALTPSGDTSFGVYQPLANGTAFKLNWKIVPIPRLIGQKDDPDGRLKAERTKIAGTQAHDDDDGMPGTGRGYSPLMGIVALNGQRYRDLVQQVNVRVGDEIEYVIRGRQLKPGECDIDEDRTGLTVDDINNALNSRRANADDLLQIGETFMIGRTVWQVVKRNGGDGGVWLPDGNDMSITLRMIENTSFDDLGIIGIAGEKACGFDGDPITSEGIDLPADRFAGISFWPLARVAMGVIRNVRPTDTTEIGIRSQVWNQANGLCNFNSIPTPSKLIKYERPSGKDENGAQLQSGTMALYFARTSVFTIWLRPVGLDENGKAFEWAPLGEQFCITGSQPVDQYNFIRISCNGPRQQMEFRFLPKVNSEIKFLVPPGEQYWRLNAKTEQRLAADYNTRYGSFNVSCVGDVVTVDDLDPKRTIVNNDEFRTQGKKPFSTVVQRPTDVLEAYRIPQNASFGVEAVYYGELFGDPDQNQDRTRKTTVRAFDGTSKFIEIELEVRSEYAGTDSDYYRNFLREWKWMPKARRVVGTDGRYSWGVGDVGVHRVSASGWFADRAGFEDVGIAYQVTNVKTEVINTPGENERWFEERSQLAEISHYDEVNKSCDSNAEHEVVYVNECTANKTRPAYPLTTFGLAVRSSNAIKGIEQLRLWLADGVSVKRWLDGSFGPSNLFSDFVYYLLTSRIGGIGALSTGDVQWIDTDSFGPTAKFLSANQIYFDGVLEDRVNLRSYLADLAPLNLCNFVIADGRFGVVPALPFNPDTGVIDPYNMQIKAVFSEGNIAEGSYTVDYLDASERQDFKAVMQFRTGEKDKLPETDVILVRWADIDTGRLPQEVFDLTGFCTDKEQAKMIGRYMLSVRRRIDHAISFSTSPLGLKLGPGDLIEVITSSAPDSTAYVGAVSADDGRIVIAQHMDDGAHEVTGYVPGAADAKTVQLTIKDGHATDPALFGMVFSSLVPRPAQNIYLVEQLDLNDDGMVEITASHFPRGEDNRRSIIAMDVLDEPLPDGTPRFTYVD